MLQPVLEFVSNLRAYHLEKKQAKKDAALIFLFPVAAAFIAIIFRTGYLTTLFLFYGAPSLYLSLRYSRIVPRAALFALIVGLPFTFIVDYMGHVSGAWHISIASFRFFDQGTLEDLVWGFLVIYLIVLHYEGLVDHHIKERLWYPHTKYLIYLVTFGLFLFSIVYITNPNLLNISYFYFVSGVVLLILPVVILFFRSRRTISNMLQTSAFYAATMLFHEIAALELGHWTFPEFGQFVGFVPFAGHIIPFEEVFFGIIMIGFAMLSYFELFDES